MRDQAESVSRRSSNADANSTWKASKRSKASLETTLSAGDVDSGKKVNKSSRNSKSGASLVMVKTGHESGSGLESNGVEASNVHPHVYVFASRTDTSNRQASSTSPRNFNDNMTYNDNVKIANGRMDVQNSSLQTNGNDKNINERQGNAIYAYNHTHTNTVSYHTGQQQSQVQLRKQQQQDQHQHHQQQLQQQKVQSIFNYAISDAMFVQSRGSAGSASIQTRPKSTDPMP
jgi:hypothetical protein